MTKSEQEDQAILKLLEGSEAETAPEESDETSVEASAEASWARGYTELLGLIPAELDPVQPPPSAKKRLMAAVAESARDRSREGRTSKAHRPVPISGHPRFARGLTPPELAARAAANAAANAAGNAASDNRFRSFLTAAVIALMMVGVSGWFYLQLARQQELVGQLREELQATNQRLEELDDGRRDLVSSLRAVGLMPQHPIDWCPLRPAGEKPVQPDAHGSLLLVMENDRWSVRIRNLAPTVGNQVYILWFLDEDSPIKRINLGQGDRPVQIAATGIPRTMTAAAVTLEPSQDVTEPSGPRILYGHNRDMDRL